MPELPEVEYTARQLRTAITGATIREALVFWERTIGRPNLSDFLAEIADRHTLGVRRRGKFLIVDLSGELILTLHRRMTGNLLLLPPGWEIDTSLKTTDPVAWNIKGPSFHWWSTEGAIMQFDKSIPTPIGADLSRPAPIDRPSLDIPHPPVGADLSRPAPIDRFSDLLYCRVCFN